MSIFTFTQHPLVVFGLKRKYPQSVRLERHNWGPTELVTQNSASFERDISDDFAFNAETRSARNQEVIGVALLQLAAGSRRLTVSGGSHDQAMNRFLIPPLFHNLHGQPI